MDKETPKEVIEAAEEAIVEIVKAPFKVADKLWGWIFEGED